jgi:acyl-CoA oxidase
MLGYADLSTMVKAGVQWGLYGGAIAALGTQAHHEKYLPGARDLSTLGCFAMTETAHGSDVMSIQTTATYEPETDELVINTPAPMARKDYIGNSALHARSAVVFAQLIVGGRSEGVHAVMMPIRDSDGVRPGISISDCGRKGGLNGIDNGRISFDHVRVPRADLLDRYGRINDDGSYSSPIKDPKRRFFTMLGTLVRGRVSVGGAAGNAAKTGLTIATRYALLRRQFEAAAGEREVLLLDYGAHQRRLLPALATSYALQFAQNDLTAEIHEVSVGTDVPDARMRNLETWAAGLKALTTDHANSTLQSCREACGGAGFLSENFIAQSRADCDVFATFEGDNTVLLQLVGKGLLTGYQHHVGELDSIGVARFMAERFVSGVLERVNAGALLSSISGALERKDDERSLLDRDWHRALFADRAKHTLDTVAARLRARGKKHSQFEAFSACQTHLLAAARAEMRRVVLESFVAGIEACPDPQAKTLLNAMCDLYVLSDVEADRGWYLEHGRLTPQKAKAISATVDRLCGSLRPHAATLVDAFDIPESLVDAQMLRDMSLHQDHSAGVA